MKENEAMKIIEQKMGRESKKSTIKAFEIALKALEEVQRYRGTGTPEGCGSTPEKCRAAVEKQTAKRPDYEGDGYADGHLVYDTWICPCCGKRYEVDYDEYDFCPNCGQKIDWSRDVKGEEAGKNEENT